MAASEVANRMAGPTGSSVTVTTLRTTKVNNDSDSEGEGGMSLFERLNAKVGGGGETKKLFSAPAAAKPKAAPKPEAAAKKKKKASSDEDSEDSDGDAEMMLFLPCPLPTPPLVPNIS